MLMFCNKKHLKPFINSLCVNLDHPENCYQKVVTKLHRN